MLSINAADDEAAGSSKRRKTQGEDQQLQIEVAEADLFASLSALPAPKNEYRVVIPEVQSASFVDPDSAVPVDAADVLDKSKKQQMTALKDRERMQSLVLRKGLPRASNPEFAAKLSGSWSDDVAHLIAFDNAVTPLPKKGKRSRAAAPDAEIPPMEVFSEKELNAAREELERDMGPIDMEAFSLEWEKHYSSRVLVAGRGRVLRAHLSRAELAAALRDEHKAVSERAVELTAQCQKLESKLSVLYQGYTARAEVLGKGVMDAQEALNRSTIDADCFRAMQVVEESSIQKRLTKLLAEVAIVQEREEALQKEYSTLILQK